MGFTIAYDVSGVDHEKTESGQPLGPVPPKGVYRCWVSNIEQVDKKKGGGSQLKFTFRVADGPHANYPFYTYIDPSLESTKWKWDGILYAFGIDTKAKERGNINSDTILGKGNQAGKKTKVRVSIDHQSFTKEVNGEQVTSESADVKGIYRFDPTKDEDYVPTGDVTSRQNGDAAPAGGTGEEYDLETLGELADAEDADAQAELTERAEMIGLDVNDYATWAEVAALIAEGEGEVPDTGDEPEEPEPEPEEDETDWSELGELADAEDEDSIQLLSDKAEELGLDINDYPLWADLATAIIENRDGGEEESEAKNLEDMTDDELRAELNTRGLRSVGPRAALILRLNKDNADPFEPKK